MSEGFREVDNVMKPIEMLGLQVTHYNRIYEAVDVLLRNGLRGHAKKLVWAVSEAIGSARKDKVKKP